MAIVDPIWTEGTIPDPEGDRLQSEQWRCERRVLEAVRAWHVSPNYHSAMFLHGLVDDLLACERKVYNHARK